MDINAYTNNNTWAYTWDEVEAYYNYCEANTIAPTFPAGTYYLTTYADSFVDAVDIDFGSAEFIRMNGTIDADTKKNWRIMMHFRADQDVEFSNGIFDQNIAGQEIGASILDHEHNMAVFVQSAASDLNFIADGMEFKNSIGGGISLASVAGGSWDKVEFKNIIGSNRPYNHRGDAEVTSDYNDCIVSNCDMTFFTNELLTGTRPRRTIINNSTIKTVGLYHCSAVISDLNCEKFHTDTTSVTWVGGSLNLPSTLVIKTAELNGVNITRQGDFILIAPQANSNLELTDCTLQDSTWLHYQQHEHKLEMTRCTGSGGIFMRNGELTIIEHTGTVNVLCSTPAVGTAQIVNIIDSPNVTVSTEGTANPVVNVS